MSNWKEVKTDWEKIAQETVEIEEVGRVWYGLTTELGALRLFYEYNKTTRNKKTRMGYSENLKTWYFSLEPAYN